MIENRWVSAIEIRHLIGEISKSTLARRTTELDLVERGLAVKLGRRVLYSLDLVKYLPTLLKERNNNMVNKGAGNV